jgi:hypothetical protein
MLSPAKDDKMVSSLIERQKRLNTESKKKRQVVMKPASQE